ncbi:radical SAM protein [Archaeoglobus neptunius]|uniref:radical SAM protein n=1 Tax=Archaeoglobus neptunius TaxID=2798580 RepID=UPI0019264074|nr:radical SAM protein [Archaeoglobus neptunius]
MYDFPPFRPPSEAGSYLIRVVRGCNWNRCAFCAMYKGLRFELRRKEDVLRDIDRISNYFPHSRTAFLGDSNPLIHPDIVEIVEYLKKKRPEIDRITAYARIKTISKMPEERLRALKDAGLTRLHMGLESGDREVLKLVSKGIEPEDAIEAGKKATKYFEVTYYIMTGLGGRERSRKHAINTAEVINRAKPTFVRVRNLTVIEGTPIENMIGREITLLDAMGQLEELRTLIERIKVETFFTCDHVSNYLFTRSGAIFYGVHGKLPDERESMLEQIEDTMKTVEVLEKSGERVLTSNDMYKLGLITL